MDIRDVAQQLSTQREEKVTRTPEYRAEIVEMRNSAGVDSVEVENQPFHVWVRLWSAQGSVVPAFNDKVASIAGLAVIVQSRPLPGRGKLEIVRVDDEILSAQDDAPNPGVLTVLHAEAHEWPDAGPGIDPVTVYPRAWSQLKVFAQNPLSLLVDVSPLRYYVGSALVNFGGGTVDLTAAVGALAAGQARLVLVYLATATNTLGTTNGAIGADAGGWFLPEPAMTALTYPSAVVRIYGGQTEIDEDDIRDRRMFLAGAGTSIDGTGVANQVTYWTGASTIAGDAGFVYDPATDFVGVGIAVPTGHLHVYDITVDTAVPYYGIRNEHTKTAGATDHDDELAGIWNDLEYDQAAGEIGHTQGIFNRYTLSDGNVGDVVNSRDIESIQNQLLVYGGKVWGDVYGVRTFVDVAAPVTGDVYGHFIFVTDEEGVGGTVYMLYLDEETDVDYGIYQDGTADNYLGGKLGIGTTAIPHGAVGAAMVALDGAAVSVAAGPHIQLTTVTDNYPLMQLFMWSHDAVGINFDCYYDGSWRSSDVDSNFQIYKEADYLKLRYDDTIAQGAVITWNDGIILGNNGRVGVGIAAALGKLHIDQSVDDAAIPALILDQGDISEQHIVCSMNGADQDFPAIVELDVTGTPAFWWDESADAFAFTNGLEVGDVVGGNFTHIESDGTVEFNGDATVWNDIYFPMSSGKIGGANQPIWAAFQGNTMEYTFALGDYIHLPSGEIAHSYEQGSDIKLHVHIVLDGSDVGDTKVNYEIEYTIGDMDETMSAAALATSGDYTITGGTADRTHLFIQVGTIAGATLLIGAALKMRFRRIALVGAGNAPSNAPFVLMVGVHIEEDTCGSRTETGK